MEDLWTSSTFDTENPVEESKAVQLLREQAKLLKQKTDGKVCATFSKLTGTILDTPEMRELIGGISRFVAAPEGDEELKGKKDIGVQYGSIAYKFELFNDVYRFRVFELIDKRLFPITIMCDADISEQWGFNDKILIGNNKELEDVVRQILGSNKVKSVIGKMMQAQNP